jgi:hypothetical protein
MAISFLLGCNSLSKAAELITYISNARVQEKEYRTEVDEELADLDK